MHERRKNIGEAFCTYCHLHLIGARSLNPLTNVNDRANLILVIVSTRNIICCMERANSLTAMASIIAIEL